MSRNAEFNDIDDAIGGLSRALDAIQCRVAAYGVEIGQLQSRRRARLSDESARLIPDITGRTMRALNVQVPSFVTDQVADLFARQSKVLGLFKPKGYTQALALLRTHLAAHLDGQFSDLQEIDDEINALTEERRVLSVQTKDLTETIKTLAAVKLGKVGLDPASVAAVSKVSQKARKMGASSRSVQGQTSTLARPATYHRQASPGFAASTQQSNDDSDLWIYAFTDVPLSLRTMVLDSMHHHTQQTHDQFSPGGASEAFAGGGASGTWREAPLTESPLVQDTPIATDDRLGLFS